MLFGVSVRRILLLIFLVFVVDFGNLSIDKCGAGDKSNLQVSFLLNDCGHLPWGIPANLVAVVSSA